MSADRLLPDDDPERIALHDEAHARPPPVVQPPAEIWYVAVLHDQVERQRQAEHLRELPSLAGSDAQIDRLQFLRAAWPGAKLQWERHGEFTRYTLIGPVGDGRRPTSVDEHWLRRIPGRTIVAVRLTMLEADLSDPATALDAVRPRFEGRPVFASLTGRGHSLAVTDFLLDDQATARFEVRVAPGTTVTRAGRIAQRLLEIETYRMLALRGLPVAKSLGGELARSEAALADIAARLERKDEDDAALLEALVAMAARVERASAEHGYRFAATQAYAALVDERLGELRELPVPGTQTIGEFLQRRLAPAIATVAATERRLTALSARIERTGALLRTRVDIATETQNRLLLEQLTRGQQTQLRLQSTVEGLSIAAITYYVVSLVLYAAKAGKAAGWPLNPELVAGASVIPAALLVAWLVRRIHRRLIQ